MGLRGGVKEYCRPYRSPGLPVRGPGAGVGGGAVLLPGTTGWEPPQEEQALHSKPEQIPNNLGTRLQSTAGEIGDRGRVDYH